MTNTFLEIKKRAVVITSMTKEAVGSNPSRISVRNLRIPPSAT